MKAILLKDYEGTPVSWELSDVEIPSLKPGDVLVQVAASPINPSDLVFLRGRYGIVKKLPIIPGFECSGTVVKSGGGLIGRWLLGKRVACHAPEKDHGTWAEYVRVRAVTCIPLRADVGDEQGASLMVNPFTASAFLDLIREHNQTAFVQTAAASSLGLMLARLGLRHRLRGIHIVRRPEQVAKLHALGCESVFDQNEALFLERLRDACHALKAGIAFDAVGGPLFQQIATAMPARSRLIVYGALSGEPCQINPSDLIFRDSSVEGFWLTQWIKTKGFLGRLDFAGQVQRALHTDLHTTVQARFPLEKLAEAISLYKKHRSDGKVLLLPRSRN
jgi:NADPH:quinone reductase-like Zn-dependent oxidoreductase